MNNTKKRDEGRPFHRASRTGACQGHENFARGARKSTTTMLCLLLSSTVMAGTGTTTADFLKIAPDSRSAALGHTGSADSKNGFAVFHNPALSAAASHRIQVSAGQTQWLLGSQVSHAAASMRRETRDGAWGFGFTYSRLTTEPFQTTDRLGNITGQAAYGAQSAGLSLSRAWGDRFSAGIGVKQISQGFEGSEDASGTTLAWDAGVFARGGQGRWNAGAVLQNAGAAAGLRNSSEELPTTLRSGIEWRPAGTQFSWTAEASQPKKGTFALSAGMGFRAFEGVTLRAGYDGRTAGAGYAGLTSGIGIVTGDFSIDYAFTPFGNMGNTQRLSVSWACGGVRREINSRRTARVGEIHYRRIPR